MSSLIDKYRTTPQIESDGSPRNNSLIDRYRTPNPMKNDKILQNYSVEEKTPEELKAMPYEEKYQYMQDLKRQRQYLQSAGFTKSLLSGATLGATEKIPALKPQEHEYNKTFGHLAGTAAPFAIGHAAILYPLKILGGLMNFGKLGMAGLNIASAAGTGSALKTGEQAIKGEGFDPEEIAIEGLIFGGIDALFKGSKKAYQWLKSLNPSQQAEVLTKGVLPDNLSERTYKLFEIEVVPELQKSAEKQFIEAAQKNTQEAEQKYLQELANTRAKHEQELQQIENQFRQDTEEFVIAQERHQNEMRNVQAKHEHDLQMIQRENEQAAQEYQRSLQEYENNKRLFEENQKLQSEKPIEPINTEQIEGTGLRKAPSNNEDSSLHNRIGNVISETEAINTSKGGENIAKNVREADQKVYREVNKAYEESRIANQGIEDIHPNLAQEVENKIKELSEIPSLSGPSESLLNSLKKLYKSLVEVAEDGSIAGYKPVNNQVLLDQAKEFRYKVDHDFAHGEPTNIFKPYIRMIQEAAENAAIESGNEVAIQANNKARQLHAEWAQLYNGPYIKPIRDKANKDFSKMYRNALDFDEYRVLNDVLESSSEGKQLSNSIKRSLVEKNLDKFMKNPREADIREFNKALRELDVIITPEEETAIRDVFNQARTEPLIPGMEKPKPPSKPSVKKMPESVRIPLFEKPSPVKKEISQVKIPLKPEIKPSKEMIAAGKKMKITPEEAMRKTDTPTGLKELKKELSAPLFEKVGKNKVKEILFEGNVERQFNGGELYKIINKGDNYALLSEILGEDVADDLLISSKMIAEKRLTVDKLKKVGAKAATIKTAIMFGIL